MNEVTIHSNEQRLYVDLLQQIEYELAQSLPMNTKSGLPTMEEIEENLNR